MGSLHANLDPVPIRRATPEEAAAIAAEFAAELERYTQRADAYARRKARETPAQRERRAATADVRKLRELLHKAADAARWERITAALDTLGFQADAARATADTLRAKVTERTARLYTRAAAGCEVCAAFLADESLAPLYAEISAH